MKATFYFILGALSILFISQTNKDIQATNSIENGVSTQQLLQEPFKETATSKLSNKTVENYLLKYLSNYTTTTKQTIAATKTKTNSASTINYSPPAKRNTYKWSSTYSKPSKSYYGYSKPNSSSKAKAAQNNSTQATEPITYYSNSYGDRVQSPTRYNNKPTGATAICSDGTYSFSYNRRGTCSRHGGVNVWL